MAFNWEIQRFHVEDLLNTSDVSASSDTTSSASVASTATDFKDNHFLASRNQYLV